jgi:hypothetical protein
VSTQVASTSKAKIAGQDLVAVDGLAAQGEVAIDQTLHRCPNCTWGYLPGDTVCSHCGLSFVVPANIKPVPNLHSATPSSDWPVGEVSAEVDRPIILQCGNKRLSIPVRDSVIVGRQSKVDSDTHPNVCLDALGAVENGVSRQHIKLTRKQDLIYVTDLDSSNGTYLNGRPLAPNCQRLLRNGDLLQLGVLQIHVVF